MVSFWVFGSSRSLNDPKPVIEVVRESEEGLLDCWFLVPVSDSPLKEFVQGGYKKVSRSFSEHQYGLSKSPFTFIDDLRGHMTKFSSGITASTNHIVNIL